MLPSATIKKCTSSRFSN